MADSVELVYQWAYQLINKTQSGELTPDQYNTAINIVNVELLKQKLGIPEEYQVDKREARQEFQTTQNNSDALRKFIVSKPLVKNGVGFDFPADFAAFAGNSYLYVEQINGQTVATTQPIEVVTLGERGIRLNNYIKYPTFEYPIGTYLNGQLIVDPDGINAVTLSYVRYPVTPFRNYTVQGDFDVYNPIGSTQIEWDTLLLPDFAIRVAKYFGVTIREEEFTNFALQRQNSGQ
jgi:hypothetical protein